MQSSSRFVSGAIAASVLTALTTSAANADGGVIFQEEGGIVVFEIESQPPGVQWVSETIIPGYSGDSYFRWDGPDNFGQPGQGVITYQFEIYDNGEYFVKLRNYHDHPDSTEENDVWVRINGNNWIKLFNSGPGTVAVWNWQVWFDFGQNQPPASFPLSPGVHTLEFSGRSHNFRMDRVHLHLAGHPGATDLSWPLSKCKIGTNYCGPAVVNSAGNSAEIAAIGSLDSSLNDLLLRATDLPQDSFGYFLASMNAGGFTPPGAQGVLCLTSPIGRVNSMVLNSGNNGSFETAIDIQNLPPPLQSSIQPGDTWRFTAWYRDLNPMPTSNFTDGIRITYQ